MGSELSAPRRYLILDASRGLAAVGVVIFHVLFSSPFQQFRGLYLLVDFFFVLSGFVLYPSMPQSTKRLPQSVFRFITVRFFRLWPTVLAAILVSMATYWLHRFSVIHGGGIFEPDPNRTPKLIIAAIAMLQNVIPLSMSIWIVVPFWSLSAEWLSNLIFSPLVAIKRNVGMVFGVLLGYYFLYLGLTRDGLWIDYMGPIRGHEAVGRALIGFGLGLLARKYITSLRWLQNPVILLFAVSATIWNFSTWRNGFTNIYWAGPIFALLIIQLSKYEIDKDSDFGKVAHFFGRYSYGIYAFHIILHDHYWYFFGDVAPDATNSQWLDFAIQKTLMLLLFSIIFTALTLKFIDGPMQRLKIIILKRLPSSQVNN